MIIFVLVFGLITEGASFFSWHILNSIFLQNTTELSYLILVTMIFLPVLAISTFGYSWRNYSKPNAIVYTISVWFLGTLLYIFLASVVSGITLMLNSFGVLHKPIMYFLSLLFYIIAILVSIYGTINAKKPIIKQYNIDKEKLHDSWFNRKIVLVSDTHIGMIHGKKFLTKVVSKINELKPDIVLIAGDLIDGPKFPKEWLSPLENINAPLGVYFTSGNHDEYSLEREYILDEIAKYTTILNDDSVIVDNVLIGGIAYRKESISETKEVIRRIRKDKKIPSIFMLHDPKNIEALIDEDITLVVSGHTHRGQVWPGRLIVERIYGKFSYGLHKTKNTTTITSSGYGTAQSSMRVGSTPEIVLITVI